MTYDQDQCYHISEYQPKSTFGHGKEIGWIEPKDFMDTIKRLLKESNTKYIISCPVWDDGFGDTVVWSRGDLVHLVEEYYSEYQWSVPFDEFIHSSFDSPRYKDK
jgi:hypothetical protein